jgi:hypothetical protein
VSADILKDYLTEEELSEAARERNLPGTRRTLRQWRARGEGPPWARFGRDIIYPRAGFSAWLESKIKKPRRMA